MRRREFLALIGLAVPIAVLPGCRSRTAVPAGGGGTVPMPESTPISETPGRTLTPGHSGTQTSESEPEPTSPTGTSSESKPKPTSPTATSSESKPKPKTATPFTPGTPTEPSG